MANADTRTPDTDALKSLGSIIDETVKRDAIHLAVEPVIAHTNLKPGTHVTFAGDTAVFVRATVGDEKAFGIVDPFLRADVKKGERFLMILLPGQIATLRHVWDHPRFVPSGFYEGVRAPKPTTAELARIHLMAFAQANDTTYDELIKDALRWAQFDDQPWWWGAENDSEYDAFWQNVHAVIGTDIGRGAIDFSCRGCN